MSAPSREIHDPAPPARIRERGIRRFVMSPEDAAETIEVLSQVFSQQEPLTRALSVSQDTFRPLARVMCEGAAGASLSVVARNPEGRVVGFRIAEPWPAPPAEGFEWPAAMAPIASLLGNLEAEFDRLHSADNRAVHFMVMGLLPDYEGLGLASLMVRDCLQLAARQGFPRVFAEATHEGSARIFRSYGFHTAAQVPYATFEHEGRRVFSSVPAKACLLVQKELIPSVLVFNDSFPATR